MGSPLSWDNWEQSSKSQLLREHVSKLDSSFHPVLSLPSGKLPHETWNISYNKNITFKYRQSLKNVWSFIFGGGGIVEMGPRHVALELFMYTKHTDIFNSHNPLRVHSVVLFISHMSTLNLERLFTHSHLVNEQWSQELTPDWHSYCSLLTDLLLSWCSFKG